MKRQDKYPDTNYFKFYNANPKNRIDDDCAIRAIATFLQQPWVDTVIAMTKCGITQGRVINSPKNIEAYLKTIGLVKMKQPRFADNRKMTGKQFVTMFSDECIANIGGKHIVYIGNHRVYDTWDSTNGTIGNFWVYQKDVNYAKRFLADVSDLYSNEV